jgi:hypothetical protein
MLAISCSSYALTFNFSFLPGTSAAAQQAFTEAGARWTSMLADPITIDMTVGTAALDPNVLAAAASRRVSSSYASFGSALTSDITSSADANAVGSLAAGPSFGMLINRTSDNPYGAGSARPYLDMDGSANNSTIQLTSANAKALGLTVGAGAVGSCVGICDASITFNRSFTFDTNPTDGITAGQFDFVGIAAHEIGHALGFVSGVDVLDLNSPPLRGPFAASAFTFVSSLDLFRYSAPGDLDLRVGAPAYFSVDGGASGITDFATGAFAGDGWQASHFGPNELNLMRPFIGNGETYDATAADLAAFDAIGWDVAAVPEPATWALFALGLAGVGARIRRPRA